MATAAQIQAEAAALPQTQDALDALLVKYSPGELAAAFPGYDQSDIDKARAAAEQREFINWQMQQPALAGQGTIGDVFAAQGITDPKNDPRVLAQAQEQIDRAARREDMFAQAGVAAPDVRPWSDAPVPTGGAVAGGGGTTSRPPATGGGTTSRPLSAGGRAGEPGGLLGAGTAGLPSGGAAPASGNRIQSIQQWYNANVGRTDPQAQADLNRFLATSGYTAREINAALPQWGLNDLQNAMRTAIGEVAKQTPFAPAAAQPIRPLAQPYTSIASQLPGGADTRMQEIRNWYAANEGRGDQAALDRFLASGYTAQELNRALPQFGVADLDRAIANARQQFPQAEVQSGLARYQAAAPGAQFTGNVSPYGLIMDQMQPFTNPYADSLANTSLGGYNPGVYNVLLDEKVDPATGVAVQDSGGDGGGGGDSGGGASNNAPVENMGTDTGFGGDGNNAGEAGGGNAAGGAGNSGDGGTGDSDTATDLFKGGLVTAIFGQDPAGPDEGQVNIQRGEYVIKKSSVKKYGQGLLDMINEGKIPAKKIKSLLD